MYELKLKVYSFNSLLHITVFHSSVFFALISLWPSKWFMAAEDSVKLGKKKYLSFEWICISQFCCYSNINSVIAESIIISLGACQPALPECSMRSKERKRRKPHTNTCFYCPQVFARGTVRTEEAEGVLQHSIAPLELHHQHTGNDHQQRTSHFPVCSFFKKENYSRRWRFCLQNDKGLAGTTQINGDNGAVLSQHQGNT